MKNRITSLALALTLALGLSVHALAAERPFTDVPEGSWFAPAATGPSTPRPRTGAGSP